MGQDAIKIKIKNDPLCQWLERIDKEVVELHHHLQLFQFTRDDILQKNPDIKNKDQTYFTWIMRSSTTDLVIRVCRLSDNLKGTESVVRFLWSLKRKKEYLNISRYKWLYQGSSVESLAERDFHNLAGQKCDQFPKKVIDEDITTLLKSEAFEKLRVYRNEYLAHLAEIKGGLPLYDHLFDAIEVLGKISKRYKQLLTGANMMGWTPTMQGDWQAVLRQPFVNIEIAENEAR